MKKIALCIMAIVLSLTFLPLQAAASNTVPSDSLSVAKTESAEANRIILRLNEIKSMDKSKLKSSEKKELRKEVRSARSSLKTIGGGVYLSASALIIIILLLIILL